MNKLSMIALVAALQASAAVINQVPPGLDAWHLDNLYALAVEQLDPIVSPNAQSSHMHRILGGSNFAAAYNFDELADSSCTTAAVTVDHSSYWAPQLYWITDPEHPDNTTFLQMTSFNRFYYFLGRNDPSEPVQAWPEGFKMLAGDPNRKTPNPIYKYYCHRKPDLSDEISSDDFNFEDPCLGGIKFDLSFPSCWDGVNLYKSDQSHMAYPTYNLREGPCPISHPVRLPSILLEYTYHPEVYPAITKGQNMKGHLAWANGDTTGFGLHADFMMGWDREILTKALNDPACVTLNMSIPITECPVLAQYFNINAAKACKPGRGELLEPHRQGDGNVVPVLPGCNPLWGATGPKPTCSSPAPALDISAFKSIPGPNTLPLSQQRNASVPDSKGWHNIGCYHNQAFTPSLSFLDPKMTPERCQDTCQRNGYSYASLTATGGFRCFCDNKLNMSAGIILSGCNVPCPSGTKTCGGEYKLDTYYQPPRYVAPDTSVSDLGCYKLPYDWASDNLVKGAFHTFTNRLMTRELCSSTCTEKGAAYSAIRDTSCYCGATLNPGPGYYAPSDTCTRRCGGNSSEICGDYFSLSIQNLKTVPKPIDTVVYRGCIADGTPRVLNSTWTFSRTGLTVDFCADIARKAGKKLFGLEYGTDCYVGDSLLSATASSKCTMPASGDNQTIAGGSWAMSLYEIVPYRGVPSVTISPVATTTNLMATSIVSSTLTANNTHTISMTSVAASSTSATQATITANATLTASGGAPSITSAPSANETLPLSSSPVSSPVPINGTQTYTATISSTSAFEESASASATSANSAVISSVASTASESSSTLSPSSTESLSNATSSSTIAASSSASVVPTADVTASTLSPSSTESLGNGTSSSTIGVSSSASVTSTTLTESATEAANSTSTDSAAIPSATVTPTTNVTLTLSVSSTESIGAIQTNSSAISVTSSATSTSTSARATSTPISSSPAYAYQGCVADGTPRVLNATWTFSRTQMTPDFCYNIAKQAGKKLFGIESGTECFIGDSLVSNKTVTGCTTPCSGNNTLSCGGPYRLAVWSLETTPLVEEPIRAKRFLEVQRRRLGQTA